MSQATNNMSQHTNHKSVPNASSAIRKEEPIRGGFYVHYALTYHGNIRAYKHIKCICFHACGINLTTQNKKGKSHGNINNASSMHYNLENQLSRHQLKAP